MLNYCIKQKDADSTAACTLSYFQKEEKNMSDFNINLKNKIHDELFADIINGIYTPGTILHEKKLIEKYNVSRSPVREALIQLCSENILQNLPKRGYVITTITSRNNQDITRYRISLECSFMQQYGHLIDFSLIKKLKEFNSCTERKQDCELTALEHWQDNTNFHLLLFSNYDNNFAYKCLKDALTIQTRYYAQKRSERWHSNTFYDGNSLHTVIVDYLEKKQYNTASNILKADIEDSDS